jgi:Family of unknown function (DUF6544)
MGSPSIDDLQALERRLRLSPASGVFDEGELTGLAEPVARYFRAAIAPGAPLTRAADLDMHGRLRLGGRWLRVRAHEVLAPDTGLIWRARVAQVITGSDRCADGWGIMDWKLFGLIRVAHGEGADVARSGVGRAAGEAVWLPTALLPRFGVEWQSSTEHDLTARLMIGGSEVCLHLHIDMAGRLEWVRFDRWGDPHDSGHWALHPFGFQVDETRTFGSLTVPSAGSAGWFHGTDRWADGEFIRLEITALQPVGASSGG